MPTNAYDLLVRIEASTEQLRRELGTGASSVNAFRQNVDRNLAGIDRTIGKVSSAFGGLKTVLGAIGITVGLNAFKDLALGAIRTAGDLGDLATQLGITAETFQTLIFAGSQFGVSQDEIANGVQKLSRTIGDAAEGNKTAIEGFDRLGIKILDAGGHVRSTDVIFREVIEAISQIQDPAVRAATGADLMGRGFQKLLPIVNEGAAGFDRIKQQAQEMGVILSQEVIDNADAASDKLAVLSQVLKAQLTQALVELAPLLTEAAEAILNLTKGLNIAIRPNIAREIKTINDEIEQWQANQEALDAGGGVSFLAKIFGTEEEPARKINELLAKRNQLLGQLATRTKDDITVAPTEPPPRGVRNPPPKITSTGKSEAEKQAEKVTAAIENIRLKLTELNADQSGDTAGKLMAAAFHDAGLSMGDASARAEELRVAVGLLADATDRAAIADEAYKAAQQADAEAVREFETKQKEAKDAVDETRTALEVYNDELARYQAMLTGGFIKADQFNRLVQKAGQNFVDTDQNAQRLVQSARQLGEGFVNTFARIGTSINSTKELLGELVGVLAQVLANLAGGGIQTLVGNVIQAGLSTAVAPGAPAGPYGGAGLNFGGPRQGGGRVKPGMAYWVGERGPEPFIPDVPGTVLPHGATAGGGNNIAINQSINLNTNGGGTPAQNRDLSEKAASAMGRVVRQEVESVIALHMRDRGMFRPNVVG